MSGQSAFVGPSRRTDLLTFRRQGGAVLAGVQWGNSTTEQIYEHTAEPEPSRRPQSATSRTATVSETVAVRARWLLQRKKRRVRLGRPDRVVEPPDSGLPDLK